MNKLQKQVALGILSLLILVGGILVYKSYTNRIGITIPTVVALFETTLQDKITSSATTMTLISGTDKSGNTLASSIYGFVIDEGTSKEEFVTANCTNTTCTSLIRGIDVVDGKTEVATLKKAHRKGASVKMTNFPILARLARILNGDESFPNDMYMETANTATASSTAVMSKLYIDNLTNQGAATSTESLGGISELATQLEMSSSTDLGANQPLVLQGKNATSTPYTHDGSTGNVTPITNHLAYLAQSFFNLSERFIWTGGHNFQNTSSTAVSSTNAEFNMVSSTNFNLYGVSLNQLIDGTDVASTVHNHESSSDATNNTYFNTLITPDSTMTVNGSPAFQATSTVLALTADEYFRFEMPPAGGTDDGAQFDDTKDITVQLRYILGGALDAGECLGFGLTTSVTGNCTNGAGRQSQVSFLFNGQGDVLYAKTGNSSATTTSVISGITFSNWNTYRIVFNPTVDAKFYVNGTLKATIATTLPSEAATILFQSTISGNGTETTKSSPIQISKEL